MSYVRDSDVPNFDIGDTGPAHFIDILNTYQNKSSSDIDHISIKLLKFVKYEISTPISHIFSLSLNSGVFPNNFKMSRTVPIFKNGDHLNCDNYRPISLINTFSKILEKMVAIRLTNHLEINHLINKYQFGFQRKISTEHNLIHVVNFIGNALSEGKWCVGVFLDLKKAFDCVRHDILLKKLQKFGIKNNALLWFSNYLTGRKQCVDIDGVLSDSREINISVLQGSVLGPLLFLCFINDIFEATILAIYLFADDTTLIGKDDNLNNLISLLNTELNKLANWFRANGIMVNIKKTQYIVFHSRGKKINLHDINIFYDSNEIVKTYDPLLRFPLERIHNGSANTAFRTFKLLGVLLDEHLSLDKHAEYVSNKIAKSIYFLNRAKNFLNPAGLRNLYFATVHSHLLYCPIILSCANKTALSKIIKLQKKAIRVIAGAKKNAHTTELFKSMKILSLEKLILKAKALFMHSIKYNYHHASFDNVWNLNTTRDHDHDLRNNNDFFLPRVTSEHFRRLPFYSLPLVWNNIGDLSFQRNRKTFSIALFNHLLEND